MCLVGETVHVQRWGKRGISVQLCWEPKTTLKKVYLFKKVTSDKFALICHLENKSLELNTRALFEETCYQNKSSVNEKTSASSSLFRRVWRFIREMQFSSLSEWEVWVEDILMCQQTGPSAKNALRQLLLRGVVLEAGWAKILLTQVGEAPFRTLVRASCFSQTEQGKGYLSEGTSGHDKRFRKCNPWEKGKRTGHIQTIGKKSWGSHNHYFTPTEREIIQRIRINYSH